ncbi:hypothetical protein PoB_000658800 [Plakobranchus ocellatus]|uniref:Uncharacterized protein n=1 Tax=Plakobranchus ocellatus TaxID=259542 RepID=A0AAV3YCC2_9GAST|nr:hypothetical protein PoB_000658800 [Plakobranchus ocellatus]
MEIGVSKVYKKKNLWMVKTRKKEQREGDLVWCLCKASSQQGDLRLPGHPSGQGDGGLAQTCDRKVFAEDLRERREKTTALKGPTEEECDARHQSRRNQESLVPWLTSANSSSLTATGHNMAAMLFVPKNRQSQGGRKEGSAVGGQSALAAIY